MLGPITNPNTYTGAIQSELEEKIFILKKSTTKTNNSINFLKTRGNDLEQKVKQIAIKAGNLNEFFNKDFQQSTSKLKQVHQFSSHSNISRKSILTYITSSSSGYF